MEIVLSSGEIAAQLPACRAAASRLQSPFAEPDRMPARRTVENGDATIKSGVRDYQSEAGSSLSADRGWR